MNNSLGSVSGVIAALANELPAAMTTLTVAALLPPDSVPWPWLQEMTAIYHPDLAANPSDMEQLRLRINGAELLTSTNQPEVAQMPAQVAAYLRQGLDANREQGLMRELRSLVIRRLQDFKATKRRLTEEVLRAANGGREVTAWTVPNAEQAVAAAAGNKFVEAFNNGDGSFTLSLREGALWEERCLQIFCSIQLAGDSLDSIDWALRTNFVPHTEIKNAAGRIAKMHETDSKSVQVGIVYGLMQLNLAHDQAAYGTWRGAWGYANEAVEVFTALNARVPDNTDISSLLKEAQRCRYLYDD